MLKEWPKEGPKLLWDSRKVNGGQSVGTGYSSLTISQGKIFTQGDSYTQKTVTIDKEGQLQKLVQKSQAGYVFCVDANTGKELWKTPDRSCPGRRPALHAHGGRRPRLRP